MGGTKVVPGDSERASEMDPIRDPRAAHPCSERGAQEGDGGEGAASPFDGIAVIGLGLIGASLAAALKRAYPAVDVIGVDVDERTLGKALELGWVDEGLSPDDERLGDRISDGVGLVAICTPIACVDDYFDLLEGAGYEGVITDTVSTKAHILGSSQEKLSQPSRYIPGHPMTGSERNGIDGARVDLFEGANWILCPDEGTDPDDFQRLHSMVTDLSARVVSIPREEHDDAVAIVSHVPHMVASSLMKLATDHASENNMLLRLAAGGFKDTTRVAAGSPKLWTGIAFDNAQALSDGLSEMEGIVRSYRVALEDGDRDAFTELLSAAAEARRALPIEWVPSSERMIEVRIPMVDRSGVIAEVATIASSVGCNIQSIEIDHISEGNAVLSLLLTDEGDIGALSMRLLEAGYSVSFNPIDPKEHAHV